MPPPPATSVASRLFLGPALRTQPDRRLVSLVRNGYEAAFEEIVRRYGKPLDRYAAAIVPSHRAEDVTQDAFSKALLALRDTDKEIELRPWLYRIVRNTALNDLRDQPPATAPLHEGIDGVETPPEAAERRAEVAELMRRLRALPDPQRAAIVMRELEGLSHEEIAAALGLTGGAARQAIYRARQALRDGVGMLLPLPLLQFLLAPSGGGGGGGLAAAGGGAAATAGGAGAGMAMKAGLATVFVAGSVVTGVALHDSSRDHGSNSAAPVAARSDPAGPLGKSGSATIPDSNRGTGKGEHGGGLDHHGGGRQSGEDGGSGPGPADESSGHHAGSGSGPGPSGGRDGGGSDGGGSSGDHHGSGASGDDSGSSGSGSSGGSSGTSGDGSGSGGSGSGDLGSGSSGDSGLDGSSSGDDGSLSNPSSDG